MEFLHTGIVDNSGGIRADPLAATSYTVDFVRDCGGDPTGVTDCAGALNTAFTLISALASDPRRAARSTKLLIPPGLYRVATPPNVWSFGAGTSTSTIVVEGYGDASIIGVDNCNGGSGTVWELLNVQRVLFHNLTFMRITTSSSNPPWDCVNCLAISAVWGAFLDNVRMVGLLASGNVFTTFGGGAAILERCDFSGCAGGTAVVVSSGSPLAMRKCSMFDQPSVNGAGGLLNTASNLCQVKADLSSPLTYNSYVELDGCWIDEGTMQSLIVIGSASIHVPKVTIRHSFFNIPGNNTPSGAAVQLSLVRELEIDGVTVLNAVPRTGTNVAWLQLQTVERSEIRGLVLPSASNEFNWISADANCGPLLIRGGVPNLQLSSINAAVPVLGTEGRLSLSVAGNSNVSLTPVQQANEFLEFTGALTGNISVLWPYPLNGSPVTVFNNTTGAFTLTVKVTGFTGFAVGQGKRATGYFTATDIVRSTPDT